MSTVVTVIVVWIAVSVLVGAGFSLGVAVGRRRAFEAYRDAVLHADASAADAVQIDLTDPEDRRELVRLIARSAGEERPGS
jgi:hypothetical protein